MSTLRTAVNLERTQNLREQADCGSFNESRGYLTYAGRPHPSGLYLQQAPSQTQMHRASLARAYLETKYKNLNQESQDREENQQKIQILNARMDQMGIAESERDKYRQPLWQEVRSLWYDTYSSTGILTRGNPTFDFKQKTKSSKTTAQDYIIRYYMYHTIILCHLISYHMI